MLRSLRVLAILLFAALASIALLAAQDASSSINVGAIAPSGASPVAYVYVSTNPSSNVFKIEAFAAATNGALTSVPGSPFTADVQYMALNGKWLFGTNGINIDSFSIASDGALNQVSTINAQAHNPYGSGGPGNLFLDHTGSTLYDGDIYAYGTGDNAYQFFTIDNSTGQLNYLGIAPNGGSTEFGEVLSFTGGNVYAYSSSCYHFTPEIYGFKRNSDQTLSFLSNNASMPTAKPGDFYCPYLAAADPTNHVAVSVQQYTGNWGQIGLPQLATYTVDTSGNMTTTSTYSNMPTTAVASIYDIWMAPSGKLLAVGGTTGLQVFHFNGASPITHYTSLLTKDSIDQLFWDNANHLYAISRAAGKLYVFTVTPTSVSQAPGSPHTITKPQNIIVLPKT